ncbi:MAG: nucleotidyltransferase domain-containing protein [Nanoarchaeota archaeon]|nr:nucleotidyltransferase domain-containing protein [Nanoarchaeota archaeon]
MISKDKDIIRFLIENRNKELNILNISKALKIDYKNVHSIIKRLEKASLVTIEKFGQSSRVILNTDIHPLLIEAELQRRKEALKDKNLSVAISTLKRTLKQKLYVLLLFGSYAKKTNTKGSDIDLMFICPDGLIETFEHEIAKATRSIPLPLHVLVFSENQFIDMIHAKESNVAKEAQKDNIILYGIENYYEMV